MTVKAIETEYKGYRFRSRLEARWAVFFDELGIEYEYEPEGYILRDGTKYLPDFYLPKYMLFIEVKPKVDRFGVDKEKTDKWEQKCEQFRDDTGKIIMIVYGDPAEDTWGLLFAWDDDEDEIVPYCHSARFINVDGYVNDMNTDRQCKERTVVITFGNPYVGPNREENELVVGPEMLQKWYPGYVYSKLCDVMTEWFNPKAYDNMNRAKLAARQARFEYGEHGVKGA